MLFNTCVLGNSDGLSFSRSTQQKDAKNHGDYANDTGTLSKLDGLLKKYTSEPGIDADNLRNSCSLHAAIANSVIEEKITKLVDVMEGLDRLGAPPKVVKALKTYHAHLYDEIHPSDNTIENVREAIDTFTTNFQKLNNKNPILASWRSLLSEYVTLYQQSYLNYLNSKNIRLIKSKYLSLKSTYDKLNVKEKATEISFNKQSITTELVCDFTLDMKNWLSNGVWNSTCILNLKDAFGAYCTRYADKHQLIKFFDFIQNIQKEVYETELIELLLITVIPTLKVLFDPDNKEFIQLYKMIVAIVKVLNIKVPILTDTKD